MKLGDLRRQITIQQETATSDAAGGYALGWSDVATVWASITPLTGREVFTAAHLEGHVTHRMRIRYMDGVTSDMRVVYGTRLFNIRAALNNDETNRWLDLLVEEGGAL